MYKSEHILGAGAPEPAAGVAATQKAHGHYGVIFRRLFIAQ